MNKILVVEDNEAIILGLEYLFKEEKFDASFVMTQNDALKKLNKNVFDLILLDITLPDGSGFDIAKFVKENIKTPIMFLTAKDEEKDVVYGLELGADDYIIKPFRNRELILRMKNVLRRVGKSEKISCKGIDIDTNLGKVFKNGQEVYLTKLEYRILINLFSNLNRLLTREELLNDIWDIVGNFVNDNTLTVYIKRIREKIGDNNGDIIETVRGIGYRVTQN